MSSARANTIQCPKCSLPVPESYFGSAEPEPCLTCGSRLLIRVFPAFHRPPDQVKTGEAVVAETESACFYHAQKRAVVPCDSCGRFLCALCDIELNNQHLCPSCVESGRTKGKLKNLDNKRTIYPDMALQLCLVPLTAPYVIYLGIRYWNAPGSVPRGSLRTRFTLALVLAGIECVGLILLLIWWLRQL
jgi:hypothetical protein